MAVKIKLQRLGKIRQPYYRIVVADARVRRSGKGRGGSGQLVGGDHRTSSAPPAQRAHWMTARSRAATAVSRAPCSAGADVSASATAYLCCSPS